MDQEVLFEEKNGWGIITLNRPKALNALTWNMCTLMLEQLKLWAVSDTVEAVLIKGSGDRAFCAGGDIRCLYDTSKDDPAGAADFFRTEYNLNSLIHHYPKPYVALMHGVIMGGGVGVSISASTRIVGENVVWAMPETGIGMVPDVGGTHFLARLEGGMGQFLGLTGHRLDGAAAVYAGIATHLVEEDQFASVEDALLGLGAGTLSQSEIDQCVGKFSKTADTPLSADREKIDQHFALSNSYDEIASSLGTDESEFAQKMTKKLGFMSPISLKLASTSIREGAKMSFDECLQMEFQIVRKIMEGPDFHEGVRAQIIDKDRNPSWSPATVEQVHATDLDPYFADLGDLGLSIEPKNF